jgi:hypothetical protein
VGREFTPEEPSPFYPPRARWYSPVFYLGNAIRRRLSLDRLRLPRELKTFDLIAGFLVPALAVVLRGPRIWGRAAAAASVFLAAVYIAWLGYPAANFAFGLLLSLHSTGFVYYCNPLLRDEPFHSRIGFTLLVLLGMMLLLYWPARSFVQGRFFTPLRLNGHVVVVQRFMPKKTILRGDWIAYRPDAEAVGNNYHGGTVWLRSGLCLAPVLAVAGDHVAFSTNGFFYVNGVAHTNQPYMPSGVELDVPEKHWFIWPNLGISGHGDVGAARVTTALMGLANVPEENYYGRPFDRWLWRKQTLP